MIDASVAHAQRVHSNHDPMPSVRIAKQRPRHQFDMERTAAVLETALEAHQRAPECREVIVREGMTVVGRDGQAKASAILHEPWLGSLEPERACVPNSSAISGGMSGRAWVNPS
jgi:hypothetical protein